MSDKIINIEYEHTMTCVGGRPVRLIICAIMLCSIIAILVVTTKTQKDDDLTKDRCKMQLESTKNLIEVIMEYKDRSEAMLAVAQEHHKTDQSRFKEVMETCFTRTQQSATCQIQLDALQFLCKASEMDCTAMAREMDPTTTTNNYSKLAY